MSDKLTPEEMQSLRDDMGDLGVWAADEIERLRGEIEEQKTQIESKMLGALEELAANIPTSECRLRFFAIPYVGADPVAVPAERITGIFQAICEKYSAMGDWSKLTGAYEEVSNIRRIMQSRLDESESKFNRLATSVRDGDQESSKGVLRRIEAEANK